MRTNEVFIKSYFIMRMEIISTAAACAGERAGTEKGGVYA